MRKCKQAVILAAGRGKRMMPLTESAPKPMLLYKDRPLIDYKLDVLPDEVEEVVVAVGYLGDQIKAHLGSEYMGREVTCVDTKLSGTGDTLHQLKGYLGERFLVMMADDIYDKGDIGECLKHEWAFLCKRFSNFEMFGEILVDPRGCLSGVDTNKKHMETGLIWTGITVLCKEFFGHPLHVLPSGETSLPHTLPSVAKDHPVHIVEAVHWTQVTRPGDLR